jgi:hypothetical protein
VSASKPQSLERSAAISTLWPRVDVNENPVLVAPACATRVNPAGMATTPSR